MTLILRISAYSTRVTRGSHPIRQTFPSEEVFSDSSIYDDRHYFHHGPLLRQSVPPHDDYEKQVIGEGEESPVQSGSMNLTNRQSPFTKFPITESVIHSDQWENHLFTAFSNIVLRFYKLGILLKRQLHNGEREMLWDFQSHGEL